MFVDFGLTHAHTLFHMHTIDSFWKMTNERCDIKTKANETAIKKTRMKMKCAIKWHKTADRRRERQAEASMWRKSWCAWKYQCVCAHIYRYGWYKYAYNDLFSKYCTRLKSKIIMCAFEYYACFSVHIVLHVKNEIQNYIVCVCKNKKCAQMSAHPQ